MRKFVPALKVMLIGSIGILLCAMVASLALGNTAAMLKMIFPLIFGLFAYGLLTKMNTTGPNCPHCDLQQPKWRKPSSLRQTLLGGWTCSNCSTEMDRNGKAIDGASQPG